MYLQSPRQLFLYDLTVPTLLFSSQRINFKDSTDCQATDRKKQEEVILPDMEMKPDLSFHFGTFQFPKDHDRTKRVS